MNIASPAALYERTAHYLYRRMTSIVTPNRFLRLQSYRTIPDEYGNSFKQFDERRCIFVHIPKTAGVSLSQSLFGNLSGGHYSIRQYQIAFSPSEFNSYFKFSFVRNPWDRLYSAYMFLINGGMNEDDAHWARRNLGRYSSFEQFVTRWVSPASVRTWRHFIPQMNFITSVTGRIALDFLGYFENLDDDFTYVQSILSVDRRIELPHSNKARRGGYKEAYSKHMIDVVGKAYAEDINRLGYDFDNLSLADQLSKREEQYVRHLKTLRRMSQ